MNYIGYWYEYFGKALLLYAIDENYALVKFENDTAHAHWVKIYCTTKGRMYIIQKQHRFYFDNCIRRGV